jgi:AraC family L-rhamnose operon regulatory protein RhaS
MVSTNSLSTSRTLAPIFQSDSRRYLADSCAPLVQAVSASELKFAALARGHYPGHRLESDVLPGLSTVGHWDAHREQRWALPWHRNEGIEIGYLESGTVEFAVDGRKFSLQPGDITVTRPWQLHCVGQPHLRPNRLHWLILDVGIRQPHQLWKWPHWLLLSQRELELLRTSLLDCNQPVWRTKAEVHHCFQEIADAVESNDAIGNASRLAIKINQLLLSLLHLLQSQPTHSEQLWTGSRQTVHLFLSRLADDRNYVALPWSLESMAAECKLKATQFVHYVKQLTNKPPLHYLNDCRLEQACNMLRNDQTRTITAVALACGFTSSQYFATIFRRHFGITPSQFGTNQKRS